MPVPTPQQAAENWVRGMQAAGEKIRQGAMRVTEAPGPKAAAAVDHWQAQVSGQKARDKYVASLQAQTLSGWQNSLIQKGLPRISAGATQAQPKMQAFQAEFFPFLENALRSLPARGDLETNLARAATLARALAQFRRGRR